MNSCGRRGRGCDRRRARGCATRPATGQAPRPPWRSGGRPGGPRPQSCRCFAGDRPRPAEHAFSPRARGREDRTPHRDSPRDRGHLRDERKLQAAEMGRARSRGRDRFEGRRTRRSAAQHPPAGVLKLIDHDHGDALLEDAPGVGILAHELQRQLDQVGEVQRARVQRLALVGAQARAHVLPARRRSGRRAGADSREAHRCAILAAECAARAPTAAAPAASPARARARSPPAACR